MVFMRDIVFQVCKLLLTDNVCFQRDMKNISCPNLSLLHQITDSSDIKVKMCSITYADWKRWHRIASSNNQ